MSEPSAPLPVSSQPRSPSTSGVVLLAGLAAVLLFFVANIVVSYVNLQRLREMTGKVSHTYEVMTTLSDVFSLMKDAETGQRGFLITGNDRYLEPYETANARIGDRLADAERLTADNPEQHARVAVLKSQVELKQQYLAENITLRRTSGFEQVRQSVMTDRGKVAMEEVRRTITEMQQEERTLLRERFAETEAAFSTAMRSGLLSGLLGIALAIAVAWLVRKTDLARKQQEWLQTGQTLLGEKLIGEPDLARLGDSALRFLCEYTGANAGVIFIEDDGLFRRSAAYALPPGAAVPQSFALGEGLLGQAAKDGRTFVVDDVPEGYLAIGSALGQERPRHLVIAPAEVDDKVIAVVELGFFGPVPENGTTLLVRTGESIAAAVQAAKSRARIEELLEETQRQSEEVQAQSEELRVSNEELEEQSQTLQRTQAQLEQQQAELEQNNMQLEAQTRQLETQRDDLVEAKQGLEAQARLVEQASRYKSAFLANMSHELRTPLNSALILAQLLAENRGENLTEEQVRYARTIQGSGNDLLALINDVLDLSKIEAGRMDVKPESIEVARLLEGLRGQFEPVAGRRGLMLDLHATPGAPATVTTDPQRLEQILRNLLSNALKFTEQGSVTLEVAAAGRGRVSFAVKDTGIGIDPAQQTLVFEPFCQGDGTTSRKYGGTGLGLSISRELARLLGGDIQLASQVGKGSVFSVILPESPGTATPPSPGLVLPPEIAPPPAGARLTPRSTAAAASMPKDDRDRLTPGSQVILLIEDDLPFAEVLASLAHDQNFQCLMTTSANEALALAREHVPSAVLLDIGLPDGSGLFVLERLKHDPRTRHIPVHVISATDYAEKALAMGAVGYMLKPVTRESLVEAFQKLEKQLAHQLRRVLVVEDDPVQLGALCDLLSSREVETVGASDAASCLRQLGGGTFDCMVLDLALPDSSGFSLLEKLSGSDSYPFPPVIIYTGRELSEEEEQQLRRYSKAIIVKGAKSPERLLDEVALFLHQVVRELPADKQRMIEKARSREAALEGRRILLAEDDVRNIFALTSMLEPLGVHIQVARNGREAIDLLDRVQKSPAPVDLVLMDIMMPEMDGLAAMRAIRQRPEWQKLPIIALTAKAMPSDQQQCLAAGASDYLAKPLDIEKLLSLIRVWMPR
jgi:signal transduction histidine kinase/CheY-like chemotaxis protein/CHASE3 domain sensor protein